MLSSGRRHHVMVMVMLSARRLTTLLRHSLGDAVCQASCWSPGDAVGRWRYCASQSGISARSRAVGPASSVLASDDVIVPASLTRHHGPASRLSCQPGIVSRRRYGGTLARHHRDCVTTSLRQRRHRDAITAAASAAGDAVRVSLAYRPGVVLSAQHLFGLR